MKFRLIFIPFVILTLILQNVSPAIAALEPLPASKTPFGIRDKYDTDLYTGSTTYSYDIKVPKGTDDLTPDVSLTYSSSGARDLISTRNDFGTVEPLLVAAGSYVETKVKNISYSI